jgi:hypothetical protein
MKPLEILSDYFASQKLSEIHSLIDSLVRIATINDCREREKFSEFGQGLHELVDNAYLIAGR